MPASHVRQRRQALGLSQVELAGRAGLTRQSVSAIEAGRATPGVDVALAIARVLGAKVEELFGEAAGEAALLAEPASRHGVGRVALAHVAGRWVSHALDGELTRLAADGVVVRERRGQVEVEPLRAVDDVRQNVVLTGCAGALGMLAERLNAQRGPGRFLWFPRSSVAALEALAAGHSHVAGVHLVDARTGEANVPEVRRLGAAQPIAVITLARWEIGLVRRPEDAARIRAVADLGRRGLRLVVREPGAGAQRLLTRELRAAGQSPSLLKNAELTASGHFEVARAIAMGAADVGIATRDAALAFGLDLSPLAEERYDLALPVAALDDPRISRLLDVLVSHAFRKELSALGYDAGPAGERVAEVA